MTDPSTTPPAAQDAPDLKALAKRGNCEIVIIGGSEGDCIAINEIRIAGNKPWGGGHIKQRFIARIEDVRAALEKTT